MTQADPDPQHPHVAPAHTLSARVQLAVVGLVAGAALAAFGIATRGADGPKAAAGAGAAQARAAFIPTPEQLAGFKIVSVEAHDFATVQSTDGRIALNADTLTPVFSPYSGRVTRVHAGPGDRVAAGSPLLTLDASEFIQAQNDLRAAAATLASAQAQLNQARLTESRRHALFDAHGGALQDWQQSQTDLATATSAAHSAEAAHALVRDRLRVLGQSPAQIDALERSSGPLASSATVAAPLRGTVIDRQVGPGQYIQAGAANPVFTIGDLSTVWLVANVRQQDAAQVRRGQPVEVTVAALPGRRIAARVTQVAPAIDPATHRLAVRASVDNPDGALKPEMFATFRIVTGSASSAPAVPDSAVIYEGDSARLWVVDPDGSLAPRAIVTGRSDGGLIEVVQGIAPGQRIVAAGSLFIDRAAGAD